MRPVLSLLLTISLQGCFFVSGGEEDDRLADLDQDGVPDEDDCAPTVPGSDEPTWYADTDGDGAGDATDSAAACTAPDGYVADDGDCDDANAKIHPDATDGCNGLDDNCDGRVDESPSTEWFLDADGDLAGAGDPFYSCASPGAGYVLASGDCDDADPTAYPDAPVQCDGEDRNCDGNADNLDADADGYAGCEECDDTDDKTFPGADETCDGADNDCDKLADEDATDATAWFADNDADGFGDDAVEDASCATERAGWSTTAGDCDDGNAGVNPTAVEVCDGVDQDCKDLEAGATDANTYYADTDGDGYGDALGGTKQDCVAPSGYALLDGDCDDTNAKFNPAATENDCGDVNDYNCDGFVGQVDNDQDGYFACEECDDDDAATNPAAIETCNLLDDDCDGQVDDDAAGASSWYADADVDGYGSATATVFACTRPDGYLASAGDCDDTDGAVHPGSAEACATAEDDDCDGTINEPDAFDAATWYADADADTQGAAATMTKACVVPSGYVATGKDCNDANAAISPLASEACDAANVDEDCDGLADDADASPTGTITWYADADLDKYGNPASSKVACDAPVGHVDNDDDCKDGDPAYYPGAPEACTDTVDYNCDGAIGAKDADLDGHIACEECDDNNKTVYPGAPEVAGDGIDQDCDGVESCYKDTDLDGFGSGNTLVDSTGLTCTNGLSGNNKDCDETSASDYPGATEIVGNLDDDDCDGVEVCYTDGDDDGYGITTTSKSTDTTCGTKLATQTGDCNDGSAVVRPGAMEVVGDGVDQNCDGREICYVDADGDKYGITNTLESNDTDCTDKNESGVSTDCKDENAAQNPGATEIVANGVDENCNGKELCYVDTDNDKYGSSSTVENTSLTCSVNGVAPRAGDCNNSVGSINPGATEVVSDATDQNCDGGDLCYIDQDVDGLRHDKLTTKSADLDCVDFGEGATSTPIDCNDLYAQGDADGDGTFDCSDKYDIALSTQRACPRWVDDGAPAVTLGACGDLDTMCNTIAKAFADAGSCPLIFVMPGTYTELVDFGGKDYQLVSVEGAAQTTISGTSSTRIESVFVFDNAETHAALVQGFQIRNGQGHTLPTGHPLKSMYPNARFGGGVYISNASPTLLANSVRNNFASGLGGGVFVYGTNPDVPVEDAGAVLMLNAIELNGTTAGGGGLTTVASTTFVYGNVIADNTTTGSVVNVPGAFASGDASAYYRNAIYSNGGATGANVAVMDSNLLFANNLVLDAPTNLIVIDLDTSIYANNTLVGGQNGVVWDPPTILTDPPPKPLFVNNQVTYTTSCGLKGAYGDTVFTTNNVWSDKGTALCDGGFDSVDDSGNLNAPVTYDTATWRLYDGSGGIGVGTNLASALGFQDDFDTDGNRSATAPWTIGAQEDTAGVPPAGD